MTIRKIAHPWLINSEILGISRPTSLNFRCPAKHFTHFWRSILCLKNLCSLFEVVLKWKKKSSIILLLYSKIWNRLNLTHLETLNLSECLSCHYLRIIRKRNELKRVLYFFLKCQLHVHELELAFADFPLIQFYYHFCCIQA